MTSALDQEVLIMNVSLTPELEKFVADKVASGWFKNASEVVRQSLREMKEQDDKYMAKVREDIEIGWQQARAGLGVDGPTFMRKVHRRLLKAKREMDKKLKDR
jgi:antitoxin ParD1/3/4